MRAQPGRLCYDQAIRRTIEWMKSMETFTRRNLPHWYMPAATHFITFRLADSLPRVVLDDLREQKSRLMKRRIAGHSEGAHRESVHKRLFTMYDDALARHRDVNWLADPRVAALVRRSLHFWNGTKYGLLAYCIMPNHVHLLARPFDAVPTTETDWDQMEPGECANRHSPMSKMMHSLKSYTAHEANKILGRTGPFWQHESYDHWVRDDDELERIVQYIAANPVAAGLVARPVDYYWCSAHERFLCDGDTSGWLVLS